MVRSMWTLQQSVVVFEFIHRYSLLHVNKGKVCFKIVFTSIQIGKTICRCSIGAAYVPENMG